MTKKLLICSIIFIAALIAATAQNAKGNEPYVGSETCMECHDDWYESYMKNYHAVKGDPRTPGARHGCESCHGPGAAHVESEGEEGTILVLNPKSATPVWEKNRPCLGCHTKGKVILWHGSIHEQRGLACSNCHNPHQEYPKGFSKPTETEVCTQCHKRIKAELLRQSHHPIREGKMQCSDCHNSHGTVADRLVNAQYGNFKCFECHANVRGPYLWEHPAAVEDCLTCHTPHGSPRTPLLKAKMPYLCQRCHSNVGHPSQLQARSASEGGQSVYVALNNRGFYRACLNCHVQIHGSNHPSGKSLLR